MVSQGPPKKGCIYHYVFEVYSFVTFDLRVWQDCITFIPTIALTHSSKSWNEQVTNTIKSYNTIYNIQTQLKFTLFLFSLTTLALGVNSSPCVP